MATLSIPGYAMGDRSLPAAPISMEEFELLKRSVLFGDEDARTLRQSLEVLRDQTEAVLDVWYGFVGSLPQLLHFFRDADTGQPDARYLEAVRERFGQWILDTASAQYDQKWLDYQGEIGRRHRRGGKNRTDQVNTPENINLRYVLALLYPITHTLKPFLSKKGHSGEEVERMYQAWVKSVLLQVILWSFPYVREGDFSPQRNLFALGMGELCAFTACSSRYKRGGGHRLTTSPATLNVL